MLFLLYFIVVVGIFIISLVFANFNKNSSSEVNANTISTNQETKKIKLHCPNKITLEVGQSANFLEGYLTVKPSGENVSVLIEGEDNGITFLENQVIANSVGSYKLIFSIGENDEIKSDFVNIEVVNKGESIDIKQIRGSVNMDDSYEMTELFNIINTVNIFKIKTLKNLKYENGLISTISEGIGEIECIFIYDFVEVNYKFSFAVKPAPEYKISIINFETDVIELEYVENKVYGIQYEINNRNEENVSQFVSVSIDNDNIASIYRLSSPIVRIKCLNKGTANLTIVCTLDTNIQKTITINFV